MSIRFQSWLSGSWLSCLLLSASALAAPSDTWRIGMAQTNITPDKLMWMGGFAARTLPAEGELDPLLAKALVLRAADGETVVLVTLDLVGTPKWLYDRLCADLKKTHGLERRQLMFANSHTHSGPVLRRALQDIYPMDDARVTLTAEYSESLVPRVTGVVAAALKSLKPCTLQEGIRRGHVRFRLCE